MRRPPPLRIEFAHWMLFFATLYAAGSAIVSGSFFEQDLFFKLAEAFGAGPFLIFLFAPFTFAKPSQRDVLLSALVGFGLYLGVVAVLETVGFRAIIFPRYINNSNIGIHYGRARGPFVEAVTDGTAMYACAVASAVALYTWQRRNARLLAGGVGVLCTGGTFLTMQRSVWIATVAASLVTGFAVRPLRRFILPAALVTFLGMSILLLASPTLRNKATKRTHDVGTVHDRGNLNRAAENMIKARPLFGFGWEQFVSRSGPYFQQNQNYQLTATKSEVHDLYLGYGAGLGLVGLLLWGAGLVAGVGGALRTRGPPELEPWRAGLVAIAVFFLIVSAFVPPQVFPNLLLWLWAGVVWAPRVVPRRRAGMALESPHVAFEPVPELASVPVVADAAPVYGPEPDDTPTIEFAPRNRTVQGRLRVPVKGGRVADLPPEYVFISVTGRHGQGQKPFVGVLKGLGLRSGAHGTTVAHDSHNLVIAGKNAADMLLVARTLSECGGGFCLANGGQVLATLALPLAGLMTPEPVEQVAPRVEMYNARAIELGLLPGQRSPILSLAGIALAVSPEVKITNLGLVHVNSQQFVPLFNAA